MFVCHWVGDKVNSCADINSLAKTIKKSTDEEFICLYKYFPLKKCQQIID